MMRLPRERFDELLLAGWINGSGNRTEKFRNWLLNAKPGDTDGPPEWSSPVLAMLKDDRELDAGGADA